jgi:predicted esterase
MDIVPKKNLKKIIIIILIIILILLSIGLIVILILYIKEKDSNKSSDESPFNRINYPNSDIELIPKSGKYNYVLIWMHGVTSNPEYHINSFDKKDGPISDNFKIILPCAPISYVDKFKSNVTSWFNIFGNIQDPIQEKDVDIISMNESGNRIKKIIENEAKNLNNDYKKIFVGGFSQGASMTYHVGLSFEHVLGGIIALSGFPVFSTPVNENNFDNLNIFCVLGGEDTFIRFDYELNHTLTVLSRLKKLDLHIFKNEKHAVKEYEFDYVKVFINSLL